MAERAWPDLVCVCVCVRGRVLQKSAQKAATTHEANDHQYPLQNLPELPLELPMRKTPGIANPKTQNLPTKTESQRLLQPILKP